MFVDSKHQDPRSDASRIVRRELKGSLVTVNYKPRTDLIDDTEIQSSKTPAPNCSIDNSNAGHYLEEVR